MKRAKRKAPWWYYCLVAPVVGIAAYLIGYSIGNSVDPIQLLLNPFKSIIWLMWLGLGLIIYLAIMQYWNEKKKAQEELTQTDIAEALRQLKQLEEEGLISFEEFELKRKQLLGL